MFGKAKELAVGSKTRKYVWLLGGDSCKPDMLDKRQQIREQLQRDETKEKQVSFHNKI